MEIWSSHILLSISFVAYMFVNTDGLIKKHTMSTCFVFSKFDEHLRLASSSHGRYHFHLGTSFFWRFDMSYFLWYLCQGYCNRVESYSRQRCGTSGTTASQCHSRGCCWNPTYDGSGTPWCFSVKSGVP